MFERFSHAEIFQFILLSNTEIVKLGASSQYLQISVLSSWSFCFARWHLAIAITILYQVITIKCMETYVHLQSP